MKTIKGLLLALGLLVASLTQGCVTTTEYVEVYPDCNVVPRKALPEIDSGVLWDALTLPHTLLDETSPELPQTLSEGYDGYRMYDQLELREKLIVDMLIENETIVGNICGK